MINTEFAEILEKAAEEGDAAGNDAVLLNGFLDTLSDTALGSIAQASNLQVLGELLEKLIDASDNDAGYKRGTREAVARLLRTDITQDAGGSGTGKVSGWMKRAQASARGSYSLGGLGMVAVAAIIFAAAILISAFFWSVERMELMSQIHISRGFITHIFTVGAIALFLIVSVAILFDKSATAKDRYERAKTILGMQLGIFGTVLGFYFGSSDDAGPSTDLVLGEVELAEDANKSDAVFPIKTSVRGGASPFVFTIAVFDIEGNFISEAAATYKEENGVLSGLVDLSSRNDNPKQDYLVETWAQDRNGKRVGPETLKITFGKVDQSQ